MHFSEISVAVLTFAHIWRLRYREVPIDHADIKTHFRWVGTIALYEALHSIQTEYLENYFWLGIFTGDLRLKPRLKTSPNRTKPKVLTPNRSCVLLVNNKFAPAWERLSPERWLLCSTF